MLSPNTTAALTELTYEQLADWVGRDAPREVAAAAIDAWRLRAGLTPPIRSAVLARFAPGAPHAMWPEQCPDTAAWRAVCNCGSAVGPFWSRADVDRFIAAAQR